MQIQFEELSKIRDILSSLDEVKGLLSSIHSQSWMSTQDVAEYLSLSTHTINKYVNDGELVEDYHYFKRRAKRFFDVSKVDMWVRGDIYNVPTEMTSAIISAVGVSNAV
jgi:hypothetical protein